MSEQGSTPKKEGVYGWRAFFLVFGCGTLAALVLVASVLGVGRLLLSGSSGDEGGTESAPSREPRESTEPGVLDVCEKGVEASGMLSNPERKDEGDAPIDTATARPELTPRTVEDECLWTIIGEDGKNQEMSLEYTAFMSDSEEVSKMELAKEEFNKKESEVESEVRNVLDDSPLQGVAADESYAVLSEPEPEILQYSLVGRTKSAVFVIEISDGVTESEGINDKKDGFSAILRDLTPYVSSNFERIVPD